MSGVDILSLFPTETITLTRRGKPGAYGPTWGQSTTTKGMVARRQQAVTTSTGETITASGTVAVPPNVEANPGDKLTIAGNNYMVLDVAYTPPQDAAFFPDVKTLVYGMVKPS